MRKKIEELRNREEGFTLVELLAVIVILGIIVAIAIPAIGNIIDNAQEDADEASVEMIESSARIYFTQNPDQDTVSISTLRDEGYLDVETEDIPDNAPDPLERGSIGSND